MRKKFIKKLAQYFDAELQKKLPLTILPTGSLVYKNYLVKELDNGNWGIFDINNKDLKEQYYTKSCALMGAKYYAHRVFNKTSEVKELDDNYWSNYSDTIVFKNNLKQTDNSKYPIILTRLEESQYLTSLYKSKIFTMFRHTFN